MWYGVGRPILEVFTVTLQAQERLKKHRWLVLGTPKLLFVHRRLTQTFFCRSSTGFPDHASFHIAQNSLASRRFFLTRPTEQGKL